MTNFMLDLETMDTAPTAAIVSIGAVAFDISNQTLGREIYIIVDLQSSAQLGGTISPDTVQWWLRQSDQAREIFSGRAPAISLPTALQTLAMWMETIEPDYTRRAVWGNGSDFDNTILRSAYQRAGQKPPWPYYGNRCFRTIKALAAPLELPREGVRHNSLDDARYQAIYLIELAKRKEVG